MKASIFKEIIILVLIFAVLWAVWVVIPIFPKNRTLVSVKLEQEVGDKMVQQLIEKDPTFHPIENDTLDSLLAIITDRLILALDETPFTYSFYVFNNSMINAFTLPGANILISSGLIEFAESPDEIAAVIAHEMGHVEKRHLISRLIKELGLAVITSGDPYVLTEITKFTTSTSYDRRQEREADEYSISLLEKAHLEPRVLATFFRRLNDKENRRPDEFEFISTHPNLSARIKSALEYKPADGFKIDSLPVDLNLLKNSLKESN